MFSCTGRKKDALLYRIVDMFRGLITQLADNPIELADRIELADEPMDLDDKPTDLPSY